MTLPKEHHAEVKQCHALAWLVLLLLLLLKHAAGREQLSTPNTQKCASVSHCNATLALGAALKQPTAKT